MPKIGKRVFDELYVHLSAVVLLEDLGHRAAIQRAQARVLFPADFEPNVAKLNVRTGRLSLLAYRDFDEDSFPVLTAGWAFVPGAESPPIYRLYTDALNPPILHRKELLVPETYPGRDAWVELTQAAEALGLFDDTTTIGFRLNWERVIASKGFKFTGKAFVPLANEEPGGDVCVRLGDAGIQRHLTALSRTALSAPVQLLMRHGLLTSADSVFDYGCGRGGDVAGLRTDGYMAHGWDPYYAPDQPVREADVVNLGFVVNVIEDAAERVDAMHRAFRLARRVMSIGVMLYGGEQAGKPYRDGFLTSRGTFQKYFTQAEIKDYVEQVLHQEAFMAGPGVAFVFADKDCEQRFNAGRFRRHGVVERLLATRAPRVRVVREPKSLRVHEPRTRAVKEPRTPQPTVAELQAEQVRPHLATLWAKALDLGRYPESDEIEDMTGIEVTCGGLSRALRLLAKYFDLGVLEAAALARSDDLRLYMATQQFSKRAPYRQLEPRLQRDIKAFFGDYRSAQDAGLRLLRQAADADQVWKACEQASIEGLGWLDGSHSLQVHLSLVDRLPAVLRAYVACGLMLWDALSEVQLVKIHIGSGKLTLMEFDDFDVSPTPVLRRRVKVNIRKLDYDIFEYGSAEFPCPLLYRKSRYLHEDFAGYAEQLAFDDALEATGILDHSEFGPSPEALSERLELQRFAIAGMSVVRSERIPDLDQACGTHFTFRSFVECGETQKRLGIANVPLNPSTYNALYDLATQILDPVIEYFGSVRLTYGFCSAELGRNIAKRVAPKLDQHAGCEVRANGRPICDRLGAACDFIVDDEDMHEVATWIVDNLPFDRLYFYGSALPLHVSFGPSVSRASFAMRSTPAGRLVPSPFAGAGRSAGADDEPVWEAGGPGPSDDARSALGQSG